MAHGYADNKENVRKRLNRIEGQVRGIQKMVDEDKYCIDILTQIGAAQAALDKVAIELLRDHTRQCVGGNCEHHGDDKVDELIGAVERLLKVRS